LLLIKHEIMKRISFIGGGRITGILLKAFENAGVIFDRIVVYDVNDQILNSLKQKFPVVSITKEINEVMDSELIVLAVHPPVMADVLEKLKGNINNESVILSLAPKFTISKIAGLLGDVKNIARMNPSASSVCNKGVNPISFAVNFNTEKKQQLMSRLELIGYSPVVNDSKIEAYAVISAMGHTYFNFQLQKLKELGVSFGLEDAEASKAITNMLWGTTETLFNSGMSYDEVANLVPVKPMAEVEEIIRGYYDEYLTTIYNKIKP